MIHSTYSVLLGNHVTSLQTLSSNSNTWSVIVSDRPLLRWMMNCRIVWSTCVVQNALQHPHRSKHLCGINRKQSVAQYTSPYISSHFSNTFFSTPFFPYYKGTEETCAYKHTLRRSCGQSWAGALRPGYSPPPAAVNSPTASPPASDWWPWATRNQKWVTGMLCRRI